MALLVKAMHLTYQYTSKNFSPNFLSAYYVFTKFLSNIIQNCSISSKVLKCFDLHHNQNRSKPFLHWIAIGRECLVIGLESPFKFFFVRTEPQVSIKFSKAGQALFVQSRLKKAKERRPHD